jgi:hypothetical protein
MKKFSQANWFIWIVSLVPGLGLIVLGKRRQGLYIILAICLFFAVFWLAPNLITWFIFGIAFIAQMAYAVGLATARATKITDTLDSNLAYPIPSRFSDKKQIIAETRKSLSTILGTGEELKAAIIGLDQDTKQFIFVGVTQEHLILSQCSQAGNPTNPQRILIDDVSWVSLEVGERNLLLTIEYNNGKKLTLHILGKLQKQAVLIVDEFPGTWSSKSFIDGFTTLQKENNRLGANILYGVCIAIMIAAIFLTNNLPRPLNQNAFILIVSLMLFIMVWPQFIGLVRKLKKEPGNTVTNVLASLSAVTVLFFWSFPLFTFGELAISIVKHLRNAG